MTDKQSQPPGMPDTAASIRSSRELMRQQLRKARNALDRGTLVANSARIAERASPLLAGARHVAGYLAFGGEVSVDALLAACRSQGQQTFVPVIQQDYTLLFAPLLDDTRLVTAHFGIREPEVNPEQLVDATLLDAVLVPLVGFDTRCARLGMGGGFYDRTFAFRRATAEGRPVMIGVAHELQCVDHVQTDWWDVPLDYVVTESRILQGRKAEAPLQSPPT